MVKAFDVELWCTKCRRDSRGDSIDPCPLPTVELVRAPAGILGHAREARPAICGGQRVVVLYSVLDPDKRLTGVPPIEVSYAQR